MGQGSTKEKKDKDRDTKGAGDEARKYRQGKGRYPNKREKKR